MALPFSSCIESIEGDSGRGARWLLLLSIAAFILWSLWFVLGQLEVRRMTTRARIEATEMARALQSPVEGRVVDDELELGRHVHEGDVLVRLDATTQRMRLAEEVARHEAMKGELAMARQEIEAERQILRSRRQLGSATATALMAQKRTAEKIASLTGEETRRVRRLDELEAIAELEAIEQEAKHERAQGEASLRKAELSRSTASLEVDISERDANIQRLEHEAAALVEDLHMSELTIARLEHEVDRLSLRAPTTGVIAEVAAVGSGGYVAVGQRLGTIVPDGSVRAIAWFSARDVVGLAHVGQRATLRLDAYARLAEGTVHGTVVAVALVPTDDLVRVEVALDDPSPVPLHHGLTGVAEVYVETTSPFRLMMRAAGVLMSDAPAGRAAPADQENE